MPSNPNAFPQTGVNPYLQGWIQYNWSSIQYYSTYLGVRSSGIVAGPSEEAATITNGPAAGRLGANQYFSPTLGTFWESSFDVMQDSFVQTYSSQQIYQDYQNNYQNILNGVRPSDFGKIPLSGLFSPTANDIGLGNVNLGQAILLIQQYASNPAYATDPLQLRKYQSNYQRA